MHFKAYGGGNALTLVKQDGTNQPSVGAAAPQFIQGLLVVELLAADRSVYLFGLLLHLLFFVWVCPGLKRKG